MLDTAHRKAMSLFILLVVGAPALAGATDSVPRRLFVAGSDRVLWLMVPEGNLPPQDNVSDQRQHSFASRLYYRDRDSERVRPAALPPQAVPIDQCVVAGQTLDVFFVDSAHYRYDSRRKWRAHSLPGKGLPLALAGEQRNGLPLLWAVVDADRGREIQAQWQAQRKGKKPTTAPEEPEAAAESTVVLGASERTPVVVLYDGTGWQPEASAPADCDGSDEMWLAAADGRFHLFWRMAGQDSVVHYACRSGKDWVAGPSINAPNAVHRAAVAVVNKQLVFAALVKAPDEKRRHCLQWTRPASDEGKTAWNRPPPLLDAQGNELVLETRTAVGFFSDRLVLLRQEERGPSNAPASPEVGFWPVAGNGKPDQPFQALPASPALEGPASTGGIRDFVVMLTVAAMLLLVFWRRQETIAAPLALPAGLQLVGPAKRAVAFAIDAAPAAAFVTWFWFEPISSFYRELSVAAAAGAEHAVELPQAVLWASFWFRVIYTSYCTVFELLLAATPGKRLLGCQVISETLEQASPLQIGIRNITRMIELEPFLKIWPFLIVVFFTRNRQRVGDLLARTIVVERQNIVITNPDHAESRDDT
jgi:uncharacterized RDD family membrane protein YckC